MVHMGYDIKQKQTKNIYITYKKGVVNKVMNEILTNLYGIVMYLHNKLELEVKRSRAQRILTHQMP